MTAPAGDAPRERTRRLRSPKPLGRLLPRLAPYTGRLAIAAVCLVVAAGVGLAFPQVVRELLDAAFQHHDRTLLNRVDGRLVLRPDR